MYKVLITQENFDDVYRKASTLENSELSVFALGLNDNQLQSIGAILSLNGCTMRWLSVDKKFHKSLTDMYEQDTGKIL